MQMYLVTGGFVGLSLLDSTEILDIGVGIGWNFGASLPSPRYGLRAANIDDRVLIFGINILHLIELCLTAHITCRRR